MNGSSFASSSSPTCGCCTGVGPSTPWALYNRPGLPQIAYRSGVHGDFRGSMLTALTARSRPALSRLLTRDDDDPSIALVDAWAVACDVLTFYTERLANESFLRTATERTSLQELGRLIAYRLNPGVAAEVHLAFTLERPPAALAKLSLDPGLLPPVVPATVILPVGLRVQSVPSAGQLPQTFETVEEVEARPEWNALPVARTKEHLPVFGRLTAWFAGTSLNLKRGDAVLFAGDDLVNDHWDVRIVTEVTVDAVDDRTGVRWDRPLGSFHPANTPAEAAEPVALRKRLRVFGHNAPQWRSMVGSFRTDYVAGYFGPAADVTGDEWHGFAAATVSGSQTAVDLDGSHPDVVAGSWLVISQEVGTFYRELYRVVTVQELSRSEFAISGTVTRVVLEGETHTFGTPRQVSVLAVADPLTLVEAPDDSLVSSDVIVVEGDATAMAPGRKVILSGRSSGGATTAAVVTVKSTTAKPGGRTELVLSDAPETPLERAGVVIFGNVTRATHGETVQQVLGDGDGRRRFQGFPLRHQPLTHVQADTPAGSSSTLTVRVHDVAWKEGLALFGAGPADLVLTTRTDPDGTVVASFGDGVTGARLPTGSHNVRATYRKGLGTAGNVATGSLCIPLDKPLGLKAVTNPLAATGGVDPEVEGHARTSMPLPVLTLGRAVSLQDYADFARAFTGIGVAKAVVLPLRGGRAIVVSVTGPDGIPAADLTITRLTSVLHSQGDPSVRVVVLPARISTFRLALKISVDPDRETPAVLAAVGGALRGTYAAGVRLLGQPVHHSAVIASAAAVPGVVAVDLDRLYRTGSTPGLRERLVADPPDVTPAGAPVAAQLLAMADDPFDWLEEMP